MRLIDADELKKLRHDCIQGRIKFDGNEYDIIDKCPTIEAEPVRHGRWEGTADGYWNGELVYDIWNCSECGFDADGADERPDWKYCPNCGAKMDVTDINVGNKTEDEHGSKE